MNLNNLMIIANACCASRCALGAVFSSAAEEETITTKNKEDQQEFKRPTCYSGFHTAHLDAHYQRFTPYGLVTAVEVDVSLLEKLRATSVYDKGEAVRLNATVPLKVDIYQAPDQFGLRTSEQIQWLRDAIKPNTVRIVDPKTLN
ncbi:hypothetical protein [Undibacterium curvum]|uniref:hypothetical protein n=1 Tax=Undibacterium curvum TaxID=2762294 RepID=UPI003D0F4D5F